MAEKSASYFCEGNKNFLMCINPKVVGKSECLEYILSNSKACLASLSVLGKNHTTKQIDSAGIEYTQCSILALLKAENIEYKDFEICFDENYSKENVHKKLNK